MSSAAFVLATAACTQPEKAQTLKVLSDSDAIQGGTETTNYNFSVGIVIRSSGGFGICTGTLIAPNLVLTARHCVSNTGSSRGLDCSNVFGTPYSASSFFVTTDPEMSQNGNFVGVSRVDVPAEKRGCGNDVALLRLSQNITGVKLAIPVVQHKIYNSSRYSRTVAAVGYGATDAAGSGSGTRRIKRNIPILCTDGSSQLAACSPQSPNQLSPKDIVTGPGTCSGDSGSGAFDDTKLDSATPYVFGVLSRGGENQNTNECLEAIYTRVDEQADFIIAGALTAATAGGYVAPAWTVAEPAEPQDEPFVPFVEPAKKNPGEACVSPSECQTGNACVNFGDGNVCAKRCPGDTDAECGSGFVCNTKLCQVAPPPVVVTPVDPTVVVAPVDPSTVVTPVVADAPSEAAPPASAAGAPVTVTTTTTRVGASCSARGVDPTQPQPWFAGALMVGSVLLGAGRRRRPQG